MKVIIVGAGPCGLLLSALLSKQGIHVQLLEASDKLDEQPRACHYSAPAKYELSRAGVLDKIEAEGFYPTGVSWRKKDGTRIVGVSNLFAPDEKMYQIVCLELGRVIQILYDEATKSKNTEVLMSHKVTGIEHGPSAAKVKVQVPSGELQIFEADFVIGCDGGNSQIRRSLFGDFEFPGKTWAQQIIATNVYYDFEEKFGYDDSNFIIDPQNWYMAAKISKDNLWRVTYGDIPGLTKDEYAERVTMRYNQMLPEHVDPSEFHVTNVGPYKMHQRLAERMRVGRFLLVGDAAHLCNPFGGFGLTGGIADVGALYDALVGIHTGVADESILETYNDVRREKYQNIVDPMSTAHFERLWVKDPDTTIAEDKFLALARKMAEDGDLAKQMRQGAMSLRCDLTEFYHTGKKE